MRIVFFGDIVARPGRKAVAAILPTLKKEFAPDLVLANGENLAHGVGATERTVKEMCDAGIDLLTSGNHIWKKEGVGLLDAVPPRILRPHNYPPGNPGTGVHVLEVGGVRVRIVNLLGRVFMHDTVDCPFRALDAILADTTPAITIVDLHAEATSEKSALGWYADGRISALVGTHTHVPTADARVLPKGTAFITDIGMTGLTYSVLGANVEAVIEMQMLQRRRNDFHDTEEGGEVVVNAVMIDVDPATGKAYSIERIQRFITV